jgi:hypothetical protein
MVLHVKGYTKVVNGKLVTVGQYDQNKSAAIKEAAKDPERPPMSATGAMYGQAKVASFPAGRDVPGHFPEPLKPSPVPKQVKAAPVKKQPTPAEQTKTAVESALDKHMKEHHDGAKQASAGQEAKQGAAGAADVGTGGHQDHPAAQGQGSIHTSSAVAPVPTAEQRAALDLYQTNDGQKMNRYLRTGEEPMQTTSKSLTKEKIEAAAPALDALIARGAVPEDTTVHRGMNFFPGQAAWLVPGAVVQDNGFVSTTTDKKITENFGSHAVHIHVPKGSKAISLPGIVGDAGTADEDELLLPRGSKFRIVSVEDNPVKKGASIIHAELLPHEPAEPATVAATTGPKVHAQKGLGPKLDKNQRAAVDEYTTTAYHEWNSALRDDNMKSMGPGNKKLVVALDTAIAAGRTETPIVVHRGVTKDQADSRGNTLKEDWLPQMQPGATLTDKGFVSTSSNAKYAQDMFAEGGTRFEITIPAGHPALSIPQVRKDSGDDYAKREQEVLLPRNSSFRIVSDTTGKNGRVVKMEAMSQADHGMVKLAGLGIGAEAWKAAAATGLNHLLLVTKNNPGKTMAQVLVRPDVKEALDHAGDAGAQAVQRQIVQSWLANGGDPQSKFLVSLLKDASKNGKLFRSRLTGPLKAASRDDLLEVMQKDQLRAHAGVSVAAARAKSENALQRFAASGVKNVMWMTFSTNPCEHCRALNGTVIPTGDEFDHDTGGKLMAVYYDLKCPPRHPNCACRLIPMG